MYRTVILLIVLFGCETWSLTLREESRLRALENWVLRGLMICTSANYYWMIKSRGMRWAGHVARVGESRGVYRVLVRKPEGKSPVGRPRRRREDNIKTVLQEVG
jgi:hypothetical protein